MQKIEETIIEHRFILFAYIKITYRNKNFLNSL